MTRRWESHCLPVVWIVLVLAMLIVTALAMMMVGMGCRATVERPPITVTVFRSPSHPHSLRAVRLVCRSPARPHACRVCSHHADCRQSAYDADDAHDNLPCVSVAVSSSSHPKPAFRVNGRSVLRTTLPSWVVSARPRMVCSKPAGTRKPGHDSQPACNGSLNFFSSPVPARQCNDRTARPDPFRPVVPFFNPSGVSSHPRVY